MSGPGRGALLGIWKPGSRGDSGLKGRREHSPSRVADAPGSTSELSVPRDPRQARNSPVLTTAPAFLKAPHSVQGTVTYSLSSILTTARGLYPNFVDVTAGGSRLSGLCRS